MSTEIEERDHWTNFLKASVIFTPVAVDCVSASGIWDCTEENFKTSAGMSSVHLRLIQPP